MSSLPFKQTLIKGSTSSCSAIRFRFCISRSLKKGNTIIIIPFLLSKFYCFYCVLLDGNVPCYFIERTYMMILSFLKLFSLSNHNHETSYETVRSINLSLTRMLLFSMAFFRIHFNTCCIKYNSFLLHLTTIHHTYPTHPPLSSTSVIRNVPKYLEFHFFSISKACFRG